MHTYVSKQVQFEGKGVCEMKRVDFFQLSNKRGCLARDREDPETQTGSLFGWPQINSKEIIFPRTAPCTSNNRPKRTRKFGTAQ